MLIVVPARGTMGHLLGTIEYTHENFVHVWKVVQDQYGRTFVWDDEKREYQEHRVQEGQFKPKPEGRT